MGVTPSALFDQLRRAAGGYLYPFRLTTVAPTRRAAVRNALVAMIMPGTQRLLQRRGWQLGVSVALEGRVHTFGVDALSDLHAITEVWARRAYDIPVLAEAEVIVDVGANIGAAVAFFQARRPGVRVYAYEPDPGAFRKLVRNVGGLPGVVLHEQALGDRDGAATLYSSHQSWGSSLVHRPVGTVRPVTVEQRTLVTARDQDGLDRVDLLKLDAEGAEFAILAAPGALDGVQAIVGELHPGFVPGARLQDLLGRLAAFDVEVDDRSAEQTAFSARRRL
jgi:FkbM family methyltransferase